MHSVRLEPTKLILRGTRTTCQATRDAGLRIAPQKKGPGTTIIRLLKRNEYETNTSTAWSSSHGHTNTQQQEQQQHPAALEQHSTRAALSHACCCCCELEQHCVLLL